MTRLGTGHGRIALTPWLSRLVPLAVSGLGAPGNVGERAGREDRRAGAPAIPRRAGAAAVAVLGVLGAAGVGYLTAENSAAEPVRVAVVLRVVIIMSLVLAGVYALANPSHARMGRLLAAAGLCACVWLLNGSSERLAFSVGVLFAGIELPLLYYILLAHPEGRLGSRSERVFLASLGLVIPLCWAFTWLTATQPAVATPLVRCDPHCPSNALFLGSTPLAAPVKSVLLGAWVLMAVGTFVFLLGRLRSGSLRLRCAVAPMVVVSSSSLFFLLAFLLTSGSGPDAAGAVRPLYGGLYVGMAATIPVAILLGLSLERQFMGLALARFVNQLAAATPLRLEALMADALHDPSLTIAYRRPNLGTRVDPWGAPLDAGASSDRAVTEIASEAGPVASILYDPALHNQERFVEAVGDAAALWLRSEQLEADLRASMADLAASRMRLVEAADAERERIERDLHDGAQQHLVGMRVKLDLASATVERDRERGVQMLTEIGQELDAALDELRSLAQGVYPPLLAEYGLGAALQSAGRACPVPVSVHTDAIGRYPADIEAAVFFSCREALQNVAKHAGSKACATLRIWEDRQVLGFDVSDTGVGFASRTTPLGRGSVNMHDRLEAIGGTLTVSSSEGRGTRVSGSVRLARRLQDPAQQAPTR